MPRKPVAGKDCFLYYSTAWASPTLVLIGQAVDVAQPGITKGKVAVPSRDSQGWSPKIAGLKEMNLEFGYLYETDPDDDSEDTVFTTLRNAFLQDTVLVYYVLDGPADEPGVTAQGFRFPGLLFDFGTDEALESGKVYDAGVELTRWNDGTANRWPEWYSVSTPSS